MSAEFVSGVRWSKSVWVVTIFVGLLFSPLLLMPLYSGISTLWVTGATLLVIILAGRLSPRRVIVADGSLTVERLMGRSTFRLADIASAEILPTPDLSYRVWASGGFMGYTGVFRTRALGHFDVLVGDPCQGVLLRFSDRRPLLISCDNPQGLVSVLASLKG